MFDLTKHKQGSPYPALALLAVALAACAPMNPEIQQEKLRAQSINEFVKYRFPVKAHSVPAGSGEYLAYFNEVNSSDLYSPKKDLGRYCQAKMGTLSVVATSGANPIAGAQLPTATHITSGQERVRERQRLLDAYATAIGNGAMGTLRCTENGSMKSLWLVSIQPESFIAEDAYNQLSTNKLLMRIRVVEQ